MQDNGSSDYSDHSDALLERLDNLIKEDEIICKSDNTIFWISRHEINAEGSTAEIQVSK